MNILQLIANITKIYHHDQSRTTRVKCDASHSGLEAASDQEVEEDVWAPIAFGLLRVFSMTRKSSTVRTSWNF